MANWANIGAGFAGAGDSAQGFVKDRRAREADEFLKKQRAQQQRDWDDEEAVRAKLAGVKQTEETSYGNKNFPTRDDEYGNELPGTKQTARSVKDIVADQAAVYGGSVNPKHQALGIQMRQAARAEREDDRAMELRGKQDAALAAHAARIKSLNTGDMASVHSMVEYYNNKFPDGKQLAAGSAPGGGIHLTQLDQKTGRPLNSKTLSQAEMKQFAIKASQDMLEHEISTLGGLEGYNQSVDRGFKGRQVGAQERAADAAWLTSGAKVRETDAEIAAGLPAAKARHFNKPDPSIMTIAGEDADGTAVTIDNRSGKLTRTDNGQPPTNFTPSARVTGVKPAVEVNPELAKAIVDDFRAMSAIKDQAKRKDALARMYQTYGAAQVGAVLDPGSKRAGATRSDPLVEELNAVPPTKGKPKGVPEQRVKLSDEQIVGGQQKFGPWTPSAVLEAAVRMKVPAALARQKQIDEAEALEVERAHPGGK